MVYEKIEISNDLKYKQMKFKHNTFYDAEFEKLPNIKFFPYVGKDFGKNKERILILAHNISAKEEIYDKEVSRGSKTRFADAMDEFTYYPAWWTKTFRKFIKGAVGLTQNYYPNSKPEIINKIDDFVNKIAYTNYINGFVKTENNVNAIISLEQVNLSRIITQTIIELLEITHCICWGDKVFGYIVNHENNKIIQTKKLDLNGFSYALVENKNNKKNIHVLQIHHPSMPNFKQLKKDTHNVFNWFYKLEVG